MTKKEAIKKARMAIKKYEKINRPFDAIFWGSIIDALEFNQNKTNQTK